MLTPTKGDLNLALIVLVAPKIMRADAATGQFRENEDCVTLLRYTVSST